MNTPRFNREVKKGERLWILPGANGKVGFIDSSGAWVCPTTFDAAQDFRNDRGAVKIASKWGLPDGTGCWIVEPRFDDIKTIGNDHNTPVAAAIGSKWGFLDDVGAWLIEPQFDWVSGFWNGFSTVRCGPLEGYVDKRGCPTVNPLFRIAGLFKCRRALVCSVNNKYGYLDEEGE